MNGDEKKFGRVFWGVIFLVLATGGAIGYLVLENYWLGEVKVLMEKAAAQNQESLKAAAVMFNGKLRDLEGAINLTKDNLASTTVSLAITGQKLEAMTAERDDFEQKYIAEKNLMEGLNSQMSEIQGKVGTLEKLQNTDKELLMKYSKVYFLSENYKPESLKEINSEYVLNPDKEYLIYSKIIPFLNTMFATAKADGIDLKVVSAYRSFYEQLSLKSSYKMFYGSGANKFSADQGYSEHQLGTTIDISTTEAGSVFSNFEEGAAYKWLKDNAYNFGFILSYPKDNKYYQYEPWHWRFVGRELAKRLHSDNKNFYDLDQRDIDKYLISFFD